ncbi:hypothetical protein IPH70_02720 [Candidatus Roizmanbacteria bacterium]|jgi:hypothetical protein|nr:MAG: hypothetical protein IPH70_02720 [Candidatus Roizmanbacteria bacterium]
MTRLDRIKSKRSKQQTIVLVVIGVVAGWFVLTSGFSFLINSSVYVGNLFGGGKSEYDFGTAPKFYSVQFDEIPAATNSAGLTVSGVADNLDEIKFYLNGKLTKKIRVDSDGKFSTILSNYDQGNNSLYAIGANNKTSETKKTDTVSFLYITTKPIIEISEPTDGSKTPRDEIKVSGKTNSGEDVTVRIQGLLSTVDSNGNFQSFVRLKEGENKIKITVNDTAGNSEEKEITVSYEK